MPSGYIKQINGEHVERRIKHVQIFEEHLQGEYREGEEGNMAQKAVKLCQKLGKQKNRNSQQKESSETTRRRAA